MKRIVLLFGTLMMIIVMCFSGCSAQKDVVITDCNSGNIVTEFSSKEHQSESVSLTEAMNNVEEISTPIEQSKKYLVHFIDPKDSIYDIWYYIYLNTDNNEVFVQYDMEKMKEFNDKFNAYMDDKIKKCTSMTANEFLIILSTK